MPEPVPTVDAPQLRQPVLGLPDPGEKVPGLAWPTAGLYVVTLALFARRGVRRAVGRLVALAHRADGCGCHLPDVQRAARVDAPRDQHEHPRQRRLRSCVDPVRGGVHDLPDAQVHPHRAPPQHQRSQDGRPGSVDQLRTGVAAAVPLGDARPLVPRLLPASDPRAAADRVCSDGPDVLGMWWGRLRSSRPTGHGADIVWSLPRSATHRRGGAGVVVRLPAAPRPDHDPARGQVPGDPGPRRRRVAG